MTRRSKTSADEVGRIEADQVERLIDVVQRLSDEVHVLREAIDEVREEYGWNARNLVGDHQHRPVMHITSMPKDPCAPDYGERVNQFNPNDLPHDEEADDSTGQQSRQGDLW